jgi:LysR family glycine cleavage system transcriptional activator
MAKYRLPVLHYLLAFEAAARHQSIKRAADELHVTHSAVSRNLQKLERRLGYPLFERRHRRIVPTSEGELLRGAVDSAFSYIHHAIQQIIMSRSPQRLIISVDPDFASLWLVPRLADFYEMVPNMLVEIRAEKGVESSEDGRCHCAIHYSEVGTTPANGEVLFRSRLFPVCAPALRETTPLAGPEDFCRQVLLFDRSKVEWGSRRISVPASCSTPPRCAWMPPCADKGSRWGTISSPTSTCPRVAWSSRSTPDFCRETRITSSRPRARPAIRP